MVFLWFPMFSLGFAWFPREKQRKRTSKEKTNRTNQGKSKEAISNVDGVREHPTVSGNMSQRTGTSVSGNRNVGVREQYVGVREHMRTVHIVRCAACANSAQSA